MEVNTRQPAATTTTTATAAPVAPAAAATTVAAADPQSMLDAAAETKAPGETKDAKAETDAKPTADETKAAEFVDEKWEPPAVEGITRDPKAMGDVKALFLKHKVSTELAKELFAYADKQAVENATRDEQSLETARATRRTEGMKNIKADAELGGAKFPESKEAFHRAVRALGGQEFADFMRREGIENELPLVRALVKAGRNLGEDTVDGTVNGKGKPVANSQEAMLRSTYPTMFKE